MAISPSDLPSTAATRASSFPTELQLSVSKRSDGPPSQSTKTAGFNTPRTAAPVVKRENRQFDAPGCVASLAHHANGSPSCACTVSWSNGQAAPAASSPKDGGKSTSAAALPPAALPKSMHSKPLPTGTSKVPEARRASRGTSPIRTQTQTILEPSGPEMAGVVKTKSLMVATTFISLAALKVQFTPPHDRAPSSDAPPQPARRGWVNWT
mmetsp:Transcript_118776/g.378825  ORF Transcript_118776/g.378825 Transcript_118776/m.378825 type:complete len:210 (+) Transcript_118776:2048-2677(+)